MFSIMAVPISMPTISAQWFPLLHILNNTFHLLTFLIVMIPNRCEVMSYCGLDLMISEVEHLFIYLTSVGHLSIFGKLSFRSFSYFLNCVIGGGAVELLEFHIYFGYQSSIGCKISKYFLQFYRLTFHFILSFAVQKCFSLM